MIRYPNLFANKIEQHSLHPWGNRGTHPNLVTRCQSSWLKTKFDELLLKTGKFSCTTSSKYGKTSSTNYSLSRFTKLSRILCNFQPMHIMRSLISALQIPTKKMLSNGLDPQSIHGVNHEVLLNNWFSELNSYISSISAQNKNVNWNY